MYLVQNAWKSITRNKPRNILMGIVIFVIVIASCVSLSIQQAAETVKESTLDNLSITATITFDRTKAMAEMQANGSFDKNNFNKTNLMGTTFSLDNYLKYTEAQSDGDSYYYFTTASLDASADILPYGDSSSSSMTTIPQSGMESGGAQGGKGGMIINGDFEITGFSSYQSMLSMFGEDGTYSVTVGEMFDEISDDLSCIISDELALYNNLTVGDIITLANPNKEDETYDLTISGIYTNSSSSEGSQTFSVKDPANNIYMSHQSLSALINTSGKLYAESEVVSDAYASTALVSQINFTYTFATAENFEKFAENIYSLGLSTNYTVSSPDLSAFESSISPLESLSKMAGWFFLVVLSVGGIILIVLNIFNLRERKYEVGVLTAIGMNKHKVATQFVFELFIVTFMVFIIGTSVGAAVSVPVTNALLANQVTQTENATSTVNQNYGFKNPQSESMNGGQAAESDSQKQGIQNKWTMQSQSGNVSYVDSISSATNLTVVLQLIGVGLLLTIISSVAAMITIMRYEPLKILSSRS